MRVIAGEFRSRRLKSLPGLNTRPTPDRLRETLFDVIAPRLPDCIFMDVYAGTGAVGIEALSRGARRSIFIERNRAAAEVIHQNLTALDLESRAEVFTSKASIVLERVRADIVFLDPPYEMAKEYESSMVALAASESPLVVVQHSSRFTPQAEYELLRRYRVIKQGDNSLSFYE
ncbi:MAG: 16S rRNA (guanine(966)-N(2))-methyltransferase RsmD [Bryobacterales bacterium]|nr:16S rRNA (guanine(966)-N(2))-methyltransferase RsmD [Bryobacterales bacterium]